MSSGLSGAPCERAGRRKDRAMTGPLEPRIVFVGCVAEGRRSLGTLLDRRADVVGVFTLRPDLAAKVSGVVPWTQLLHREILRLLRLGCVGFHASRLPLYRGRAPVNWAIIQGEKETGR